MTANAKHGSFDWIVDYEAIKPYLHQYSSHNDKINQIVANIGCGTSMLSRDLADDGYGQVEGLDNDFACVEFMRNETVNNSKLHWYHYDLVDQTGRDADYFRCSCADYYDIIIDKGTFDAILVEGTIASMLREVIRLLKPETGVYVLCSINKLDLIRALFSLYMLGLDCEFHEVFYKGSDNRGSIVIARKIRCNEINLQALTSEEERIMNEHFQVNHPLLTVENELRIRERLDTGVHSHSTMFTPEFLYEHIILGVLELSALDYSYELFAEDLKSHFTASASSHSSNERLLTCNELIEFLRHNQ